MSTSSEKIVSMLSKSLPDKLTGEETDEEFSAYLKAQQDAAKKESQQPDTSEKEDKPVPLKKEIPKKEQGNTEQTQNKTPSKTATDETLMFPIDPEEEEEPSSDKKVEKDNHNGYFSSSF